MSSLEEINRKMEEVADEIKRVAKDIREVQTAITTLEENSGLMNKDFDFWKTRLLQLGEKEKDLREEKKTFQNKENKLQEEKNLLLERQSGSVSLKELLESQICKQMSNSQALEERKDEDDNPDDSGLASKDSKTTNGSKKDKRSAKASGTHTPSSQHNNLKSENIFSWPKMCIDNVSFETLNNELLKLFLDKLSHLNKETYSYPSYKEEVDLCIVRSERDVEHSLKSVLNAIFAHRIFKKENKSLVYGNPDDSRNYSGDMMWIDTLPDSCGEFIIEAKGRHAFGFTKDYSKEYVQILFDKAKEDAYLSKLENQVDESDIKKIKKFIVKDRKDMLSLLKQSWSYMKAMNEKLKYNDILIDGMKIGKEPICFSMLSCYQISFLVKWDESTMYISHWFPTELLLPLTYLLFLLRYEKYVPDMLKEFVTQIHLSFPQENQTTSKPPNPYNLRKGGGGGSNNNNRRDDGDGDDTNKDEPPDKRHKPAVKDSNRTNYGDGNAKKAANQFQTISAKEISDIWYSHTEHIAYSENVVIAKSCPSYPLPEPIVLKVVDQYKSYKEERDELKNEMEIYDHFEKYFKKPANKGLVRFVPKLFFAGRVDIYEILGIEFINGVCYPSFEVMSNAEKDACRESVNELHKARVFHGDLHSRNFIIVKNKRQFKAVIIDFGRSKVVKSWERNQLIKEMIELDKNLIQSPNTSSDLDVSC